MRQKAAAIVGVVTNNKQNESKSTVNPYNASENQKHSPPNDKTDTNCKNTPIREQLASNLLHRVSMNVIELLFQYFR
ncbi:hypothetical protein DYBT9623_01488 [Dyadobacter sp. CECT 9623]|uniref:Uncharacterized protein n=1 Tax=Dyadobacter linearis TaxID=2823330 RepID=A0ABN7R9J5_9BACT|nr:hypothetical protein DYBT9623_01488 [Dyadobacter sp. CECT 9623]